MTAVIGGLRAAVTDDDLERLSAKNPGWKLERSDDGEILVSPTSTKAGAQSGEAFAQVYAYAKRVGGKAYDSSTGFKTPSGGVVSPDASWVRADRVAAMDDATYQSLMPDIAIEIASPSDSWALLTAKVDKYIADGGTYAVALDPVARTAYERGVKPDDFTLDIDAICRA